MNDKKAVKARLFGKTLSGSLLASVLVSLLTAGCGGAGRGRSGSGEAGRLPRRAGYACVLFPERIRAERCGFGGARDEGDQGEAVAVAEGVRLRPRFVPVSERSGGEDRRRAQRRQYRAARGGGEGEPMAAAGEAQVKQSICSLHDCCMFTPDRVRYDGTETKPIGERRL